VCDRRPDAIEENAGMALIEERMVAAAAATAAAMSPRVRKVARKGIVYGLAGALKAGDVAVAAVRGAAKATEDDDMAASANAKSTRRQSSTRSRQPRGQGAVAGADGEASAP
jgi:hypothetical protein